MRQTASFLNRYGAVVGTLMLVLTIELVTHLWLANTASVYSTDFSMTIAKERLIAQGPNVDVLFLGDSSVGASLDPITFSDITGLDTFNLGTFGNMTMAGFCFLLEEYLAHNLPPQVVLLSCVYDLWPRDTSSARVMQALSKYFPTCMGELILNGFWPLEKLPEATLLWVFPTLRYRFDVQRWFTILLRFPGTNNPEDLITAQEQNVQLQEKLAASRGFHAREQHIADSVDSDLAGHLKRLEERPAFCPSALNIHYFGKILRLADRNGFQVLFMPSPVDERLRSTDSAQQHLADYLSFLTEWEAAHSRLGLLFENIPFLSFDRFSNSIDHLNRPAATVFTTQVADAFLEWSASATTHSHSRDGDLSK